jgi:trk system potassium uptake protein TrkA
MNIIIIGCGKLGSRLAMTLSRAGHDVSVVDRDEENFTQLDDSFEGLTVTGMPIDTDVLRKAGVEHCNIFLSVTQDDNINIMAAQIAGEVFGVERVIARVFHPDREDVFAHFGLRTICPTRLSSDAIIAALDDITTTTVSFENSTVRFDLHEIDKKQAGRTIDEIEPDEEGEHLFGVMHKNGGLVLAADMHDRLLPTDRLVFCRVVD